MQVGPWLSRGTLQADAFLLYLFNSAYISVLLLVPPVEILLGRQKKAEVLKKMTDVAVRMSEEQLVELRADIKVRLPSPPLCLSQTLRSSSSPEVTAAPQPLNHELPFPAWPFPDLVFFK